MSKKTERYLKEITLIDDYIARKLERHETMIFGKILESRLDKVIAQELKKAYEIEAESLSYIPFSPSVRGKTKLAVVTPDLSIHIDDIGDGAKYTTIILSIVLLIKDTALLIEEVESHQHAEALRRFFPTLIDVANKNNVQLFITTHSSETIQILSKLAEKNDIRFFHFERVEGDILDARTIKGIDVHLLSDLGLDLRFIGIYKKFAVLEGRSDMIFLDEVLKRILKKGLEQLGFYSVIAGNKKLVSQVTTALVSTRSEILAFLDYNSNDKEQIVKGIADVIQGRGYKVNEIKQCTLQIEDSETFVKILPMGLPNNTQLKTVGVSQHEMEDYLLRLIDIDNSVLKWSGISLKDLAKDVKKAKMGGANKSENLLKCLALKKQLGYEDLIKEIIKTASLENLKNTVKDLLQILQVNTNKP